MLLLLKNYLGSRVRCLAGNNTRIGQLVETAELFKGEFLKALKASLRSGLAGRLPIQNFKSFAEVSGVVEPPSKSNF